MSHSYRAYGLEVVSSSPISALEDVSSKTDAPDLFFEDGPQPDWVQALLSLPEKVMKRKAQPVDAADPSFVLTQHGDEQGFELSYSDGARFVVDGAAKRVWGTRPSSMPPEELAVYFLGPVMGFLFRRRHITCLHSSGVEIQGHAICLCGETGLGKSTTAAALALRGFPVVAEDIVVLEEAKKQFVAVPGYPRVCLWPESVQLLMGREDALPLIADNWEKRYLPLDGQSAKFAAGKLPLALVYLFADRVNDANAPRIEKLSPREAVLLLVRNTYMNWLLGREQRAREFETLCRLVEQVSISRVVPHAQPERIGELCECIVRDASTFLSARKNAS